MSEEKSVIAALNASGEPDTDDSGNNYVIADNKETLVRTLNPKIAFVESRLDYARFRDDGTFDRFLSSFEASELLAPYRFITTNAKGAITSNESAFTIWKQQPNRRTYGSAVFRPTGILTPPDHVKPDELNTWTGLAVAPDAGGKWTLLDKHLLHNVSRDDKDLYGYLLDWAAQMFREPHDKLGVAPWLIGAQGVGKSKFGDVLRKIIGPRHSRIINNPKHMTGQFNALFLQMLFIQVEEIGIPSNAEEIILHMITSDDVPVEFKGRDIGLDEKIPARFMFTKNPKASDRSVIRPGDRRGAIFDVAGHNKQDAKYFAAIDAQMQDGGLGGLLYHLLNRDVRRLTMQKPPMTEAKRALIEDALDPCDAWLLDAFTNKRFRYRDGNEIKIQDWPADDSMLDVDTLTDSLCLSTPRLNAHSAASMIGRRWKKYFGLGRLEQKSFSGSRYSRRFGKFEKMRAQFESHVGLSVPGAEVIDAPHDMTQRVEAPAAVEPPKGEVVRFPADTASRRTRW